MGGVNVPVTNGGETDHNEPVRVKEIYSVTQVFKMVDEADTTQGREHHILHVYLALSQTYSHSLTHALNMKQKRKVNRLNAVARNC